METKKPVKVLQVAPLGAGGVTSLVLNIAEIRKEYISTILHSMIARNLMKNERLLWEEKNLQFLLTIMKIL